MSYFHENICAQKEHWHVKIIKQIIWHLETHFFEYQGGPLPILFFTGGSAINRAPSVAAEEHTHPPESTENLLQHTIAELGIFRQWCPGSLPAPTRHWCHPPMTTRPSKSTTTAGGGVRAASLCWWPRPGWCSSLWPLQHSRCSTGTLQRAAASPSTKTRLEGSHGATRCCSGSTPGSISRRRRTSWAVRT